ncbi:MAG: hypothetical protein HN929_06185, partial [Chloroflexi bacterium]|nr:hypothetical protein [Chloroflexota bacterium]
GDGVSGGFDLTNNEMAYLHGATTNLIGQSDGTGAIAVGTFTHDYTITILSLSGAISITGDVTMTGDAPLTIETRGAHTDTDVTLEDSGSITMGSGTLNIMSGTGDGDVIIETGGTGISSTDSGDIIITSDTSTILSPVATGGTFTIQPTSAAADPTIGIVNDIGLFTVNTNELPFFRGQTNNIIGRADGTGAIQIGTLTFDNYPLTVRSLTGTITVAGKMTMGNRSLTLISDEVLANAVIETTGTVTLKPSSTELTFDFGSPGTGTFFSSLAHAANIQAVGGCIIGREDGNSIDYLRIGSPSYEYGYPLTVLTNTGRVLLGDIEMTGGDALVFGTDEAADGGEIYINGTVVTNGGNFTAYGETFDITVGSLDTGGGNVNLTYSGVSTIDAAITSGAGDVTIITDQIALDAPITLSGTLTIEPYTDTPTLALGDDSTGRCRLDDAELLNLRSTTANILGNQSSTTQANITTLKVTGAYPITVLSGGGITITKNVSIAGGDLAFSAQGAFTATTADKTIISSAGADISITAATIALNTAAKTTTGAITLQPYEADTAINIGTGTGAFDLSAAEIGAFTDGASGITIGRSDGTHTITIDAIEFTDPVTIQSGGASGNITVAGALATSGSGDAMTLDAGGGNIDINAVVTTNDGLFTSTGADFDNTGGTITTSSANSARGITIDHTGAVTIGAALSSSDGAVNLDSTESTITLNSTISSTTGNVTIDSAAASATTISAAGNITTTTGTVIFGAARADTLTTAGDVTTTNALITFSNAVTLDTGATVSINSGTGAGDIWFKSTIEGTDIGNETLTVNAGEGYIALDATVGDSKDLGAISLTSNTIALGGNVTGSSTIVLQPYADSTTIGIGGTDATGAYNLTATEIGYLQNSFSGITIGGSSGTGAIEIKAVTFKAPVTIRTNTTGGGTITVAEAIACTGDASFEIIGANATTNLNANIVTVGAAITINDSVVLGSSTILLNTTDGGDADGANISISGTTNSATDADNSLIMNAGNVGTITLTGAVGNLVGGELGTITITDSNGATFVSTVEAAALTIADTKATGTVAVQGNLILTGALTANIGTEAYSLSITGGANSVAAATLSNTGALTLGNGSSDTFTATGGAITATAQSDINIAGTIASNSGTSTITLGDFNTDVAVTADATVGGSATGTISLGDSTLSAGVTLTVGASGGTAAAIELDKVTGSGGSGNCNLTINTGGAVTVAEAIGTDIDTIRITDSAGVDFLDAVSGKTLIITDCTADAITFAGDVTLTTGMTVNAGTAAYAVSFDGADNTIAGTTTFLNTGSLTLGTNSATDSFTFTGGLTAITQSAINLFGLVKASGIGVINLGAVPVAVTGTSRVGDTSTGQITIGAVTMSDNVTLTVGNNAGTPISLAAVSGTADNADSHLTINTSGAVTVSGIVGTDIGTILVTKTGGLTFNNTVNAVTVTLANTTGTITFSDTLTVTGTLDAQANAYNVVIDGGGTITDACEFLNTGTLTIGSTATVFTGGVIANSPSSVILEGGQISAGGSAGITLGETNGIAVTGSTTVGGTTTGTISLGDALLSHGVTLT